jgi:exonuclease III
MSSLTEPMLKEGVTDVDEYTASSSLEKSVGENRHSQVTCLTWDKTTHPTTPMEFKEKHRGIHWTFLADPGVSIAVIYVPPDGKDSDEYVANLFKVVMANLEELGSQPFMLGGDFNVPFKQAMYGRKVEIAPP